MKRYISSETIKVDKLLFNQTLSNDSIKCYISSETEKVDKLLLKQWVQTIMHL